MTRLHYYIYRLASWAWYWAPRRLTPGGLLASIALLVSGVIGIDMDQTVAFQAFALVASLLAVSISTAGLFRGRFVVRRMLPKFGSVGQILRYHVRVRNGTAKGYQDLELLENLADVRPTFAEFNPARQPATRRLSLRLDVTPSPSITHRQATIRAVALPALPP